MQPKPAQPMQTMPARQPRQALNIVLLALMTVFLLLVIRRAWMCDDAYITFRTVDNLLHGHHLTWNTTERVQAYTHPLWMLLVSLAAGISGEMYLTVLACSIALSLGAVAILAFGISRSPMLAALGVFGLVFSRAFVDFSTSGLENPLSHFLFGLFGWFFLGQAGGRRRLFALSFLASLVLVTRMDLVLVLLPALVVAYVEQGEWRRGGMQMLAGMVPFFAWELFSIFYYGFPFPNTAYAKLNTGIPGAEMARQGLFYLLNAARFDMVTVVLLACGLAAAFLGGNRRQVSLGLGVVLYLVYLVGIGGDFMSGRFLSVPLFMGVILLVQPGAEDLPAAGWVALFGLLALLGMNVVNPTLRINDLGPIDSGPIHQWDHGILDERMLYYGGTGLLNTPRDAPMPTFYWAQNGEEVRTRQLPLADNYAIGFFGYAAGPQVYILDKLALADPLLARLPARRVVNWRVGHYEREMPAGYLQTLLSGRNFIEDPGLALFYDKLSIIVKGPLMSPQRLAEIWRMNTGQYDHLVNREAYRYPGQVQVSQEEAGSVLAEGTPCRQGVVPSMTGSGAVVSLSGGLRGEWMQIGLQHDDRFQAVFLRGTQEVATLTIPTARLPEPGGISRRILPVPERAVNAGVDRVMILPLSGEEPYCLGYLQFPGVE